MAFRAGCGEPGCGGRLDLGRRGKARRHRAGKTCLSPWLCGVPGPTGQRTHRPLAVARDRSGATERAQHGRSEEHTSELQSLMRNSYAVFRMTKKKDTPKTRIVTNGRGMRDIIYNPD